jgi:lantibiotic modifying enzyme
LSQKATNINQEMVCWSSDKFSNLGGFSHGTASYSVAMLLAYDLLKDSRYFNLFEKSLNHDRSLFSSEHNMYKDNRYYPKIQFSNSWAHGSGGIGLSRLLLADFLPEYSGLNREIEICRNNLNKGLEFQSDYAVSGGFSGNIEVLRALNNFCGADNTYLHDIILGKIKQYKSNPVYFATANHHIHLLMNTGIAGFAYTLMRYLAPETTPSILNLSINTNFGSKCLYAK